MHRFTMPALLVALLVGVAALPARAQARAEKIILDTDIGDDIDDAYALALLCAMRNVKLLGVTTTFGQTHERAQVAGKLLHALGRDGVPVYAGRQGDHRIGKQWEWARDYTSPAIKSESAVEFLHREIERQPGEITLVAIGPLTNLGDLLARYPDVKGKIRRIVIMGGAVYSGYGPNAPVTPEWNIRCDPAAAKAVYASGVPLVMAGLEVTAMMQLDAERQRSIYAYGTPGTNALAALTHLWSSNGVPTLFDPVAVAHACGHPFADAEQQHVEVESDGLTRITPGAPNVTVLVHPRKDAFLDWYVSALKPGK